MDYVLLNAYMFDMENAISAPSLYACRVIFASVFDDFFVFLSFLPQKPIVFAHIVIS